MMETNVQRLSLDTKHNSLCIDHYWKHSGNKKETKQNMFLLLPPTKFWFRDGMRKFIPIPNAALEESNWSLQIYLSQSKCNIFVVFTHGFDEGFMSSSCDKQSWIFSIFLWPGPQWKSSEHCCGGVVCWWAKQTTVWKCVEGGEGTLLTGKPPDQHHWHDTI